MSSNQVCMSCGSQEFEQTDLGALICLYCGVRCHILKEELEFEDSQQILSQVKGKHRHNLKKKRKAKVFESSPKLTQEACLKGFQSILKQNAERLVARCGCPAAFPATVRRLWFAFLEEWALTARYGIEQAFVSRKVAGVHLREARRELGGGRGGRGGGGGGGIEEEEEEEEENGHFPLDEDEYESISEQPGAHLNSSSESDHSTDKQSGAGGAKRAWTKRLQSGVAKWWDPKSDEIFFLKSTPGPLRAAAAAAAGPGPGRRRRRWRAADLVRPSAPLGLAALALAARLHRLPLLPGDIIRLAANGVLIYTNAMNFLPAELQHQLERASEFFNPIDLPTYTDMQFLQSRLCQALRILLPPLNFSLISATLVQNLGLPNHVMQRLAAVHSVLSDDFFVSPIHAAAGVLAAVKACRGWECWQYTAAPALASAAMLQEASDEGGGGGGNGRRRGRLPTAAAAVPWSLEDLLEMPRSSLADYFKYFEESIIKKDAYGWTGMKEHSEFLRGLIPEDSHSENNDGPHTPWALLPTRWLPRPPVAAAAAAAAAASDSAGRLVAPPLAAAPPVAGVPGPLRAALRRAAADGEEGTTAEAAAGGGGRQRPAAAAAPAPGQRGRPRPAAARRKRTRGRRKPTEKLDSDDLAEGMKSWAKKELNFRQKFHLCTSLSQEDVSGIHAAARSRKNLANLEFCDFKKCIILFKKTYGGLPKALLHNKQCSADKPKRAASMAEKERFVVPFSKPWPPSCWGLPLRALLGQAPIPYRGGGNATEDDEGATVEGRGGEGRAGERWLRERPERLVGLRRLLGGAKIVEPDWLKPRKCWQTWQNSEWRLLVLVLCTHKHLFGHVQFRAEWAVPAARPWPAGARGRWLGVRLRLLPRYARGSPEREQALLNLGLRLPYHHTSPAGHLYNRKESHRQQKTPITATSFKNNDSKNKARDYPDGKGGAAPSTEEAEERMLVIEKSMNNNNDEFSAFSSSNESHRYNNGNNCSSGWYIMYGSLSQSKKKRKKDHDEHISSSGKGDEEEIYNDQTKGSTVTAFGSSNNEHEVIINDNRTKFDDDGSLSFAAVALSSSSPLLPLLSSSPLSPKTASTVSSRKNMQMPLDAPYILLVEHFARHIGCTPYALHEAVCLVDEKIKQVVLS